MSEADIRTLKAYINAIDTFGTIDYKCINKLYEPIENVLKELDKKDKVIQEMAEKIDVEFGSGEDPKFWIDYFYKKVEEENDNN